MKRLLLFFLLAALMLSTVACVAGDITVSTDQTELSDSVHIDADTADKLKEHPENTVIRVYDGVFMNGFAQKKTIRELILAPYTRRVTYLVVTNEALEQIEYMAIHEDIPTEIDRNYGEGSVISRIVTKPGLALSSIKGDINVQEIYCLNGEVANNGIYIYFVTDRGDYVYYNEYAGTEHEYLFTVAQFYDIAPVIQEQLERNRNNPGGIVTIEDIEGIDTYRIQSGRIIPSTVWILPMVLAVLVAVISSVLYVHNKKHHKEHHKEQYAER